ncbi:MAG: hypothetical protein ACRD36_06890, partial [Candidatus Acidiferrum sp.]
SSHNETKGKSRFMRLGESPGTRGTDPPPRGLESALTPQDDPIESCAKQTVYKQTQIDVEELMLRNPRQMRQQCAIENIACHDRDQRQKKSPLHAPILRDNMPSSRMI